MAEGTSDAPDRTVGGRASSRRTRALAWGAALAVVLVVGVGIGLLGNRGSTERVDPEVVSDDGAQDGLGGADAPTENNGHGALGGIQPAPAGSALATITSPPQGTLAMVEASALAPDARYSVQFSPYGYGPPQGGQTLVVRISSATPQNDSAREFDFSGRNVLVQVASRSDVAGSGGAFTGTLTFRSQGKTLVPVLGDIAVAE